MGIVAVGHLLNELVGAGHAARLGDLLIGGVLPAPTQVLPNGAGEQGVLLQHHGAAVPQRFHGVFLYVVAAHVHRALVDLVQPRDHADQRGFGAAGAAQNAHRHAAFDMQVDIRQVPCLRRGMILEVHMVKADVAVLHGQGAVGLFVGDLRLLLQHLLDTLAAGDGAGQHHQHHGHHHQGHEDLTGVGEEGHQVAGEQRARRHVVAAQPHEGHDGAAHQHHHHRHEHHHKAEGPLGGLPQRIVAPAELLGLLFLADEGFHHAHGVEVLLHHKVHVIRGALQSGKERPHIADHHGHRQDQQRHHHQKHPAQVKADLQRLHQRGDQHDRGTNAHPHAHEQRHLHRGNVVGQPGDQRCGGEMLNIGKGKPLHLLILRLTHLRAEAHGGLCGKHRRAHAAGQCQKCQHQHLQTCQQNIGPVAVGDTHVHDLAHGLGQLQLQHRFRHGACHAQ